VVSSIPVLRAKLHVSAIEQKFDHAKISCVPKIYLRMEEERYFIKENIEKIVIRKVNIRH